MTVSQADKARSSALCEAPGAFVIANRGMRLGAPAGGWASGAGDLEWRGRARQARRKVTRRLWPTPR